MLVGGLPMIKCEWKIREVGFCCHPERSTRRGGSWRTHQFPALVFELVHPRVGRILFDTGYSQHFINATRQLPERLYRVVTPVHFDESQSLRRQLSNAGIDPDSIALIVLSHLHGDHIGGVKDFPLAQIMCSKIAADDMSARNRVSALSRGLLPSLLPNRHNINWIEHCSRVALDAPFSAFGHALDLLADGSLLAVELPGHAAGHYGLLFRDVNAQTVFLVADAVWSSQSIRDNTPPPQLVTSWMGDTALYRDTLKKLHDLSVAAPSVLIVPSHCQEWRRHVSA